MPAYDDTAPVRFSESSSKSLSNINICNIKWLNNWPDGQMLLLKNGYIYKAQSINAVFKLTDEGGSRILKGYWNETGIDIRIFFTKSDFLGKLKECMK